MNDYGAVSLREAQRDRGSKKINCMKLSLTRGAVLLIWSSFFLSTWGTYLRNESVQFPQWLESIHGQYNDLPGAGLWLVYCWECNAVISLMGTVFISAILLITKETENVARIVVKLVTIVFLSMSLLVLVSALKSLFWGFLVLGMGEMLLVIGLLCGMARWHWF